MYKQTQALKGSWTYYYSKLKVLNSLIIQTRFVIDIFSCPFLVCLKSFF